MASNGVAADIMQEIGAGQQETVQGQDASETAQTKEAAGEVQRTAVPQTIDQLLDEGQVTHLKHLLRNIPTLTGNTELFGQPEEVFVDTMSEDATGAAEQANRRENTIWISGCGISEEHDCRRIFTDRTERDCAEQPVWIFPACQNCLQVENFRHCFVM